MDEKSECPWKRVNVIYNGRNKNFTYRLPKGEWEIIADGKSGACYHSHTAAEKKVEVEAVSFVMIGER